MYKNSVKTGNMRKIIGLTVLLGAAVTMAFAFPKEKEDDRAALW